MPTQQTAEFHPATAAWLKATFDSPTPIQKRGWKAIATGDSTLIAAPTGSGKTLAAFLWAIDTLFKQAQSGNLNNTTQVLYVSPLRALSNDIHKNLIAPLEGISQQFSALGFGNAQLRAAVRTGDTPQHKRAALLKHPPHILVTTPESLYLLLTAASGRKMLQTVQTVIVDEIHAVAGNRRGSHLALSLARLAELTQSPLQRIGLSATQKPLSAIAQFLGGEPCHIVNEGHLRTLDLRIEVPPAGLSAVMENDVWSEVYERIADLARQHRTTLVFVNTRRMCERVTSHLSTLLGAENVASHHGSLAADLRLHAEQRLKNGELRVLVATASLELGIDIGDVDLVCQLASPRSIAGFLQRVGRSGHRHGGIPKGRLFPLTRDDLVECTALLASLKKGELDALLIPVAPLDILAQHIVAAVACEEWELRPLYDMLHSATPYSTLTYDTFMQVIHTLAHGYSTQRGRRAAHIHLDAVNQRVTARRGARLAALTGGGAIADNADYRVVEEPTGTFIGTLNEDFAIESNAGDIFQLGNASWRIERVGSGVVYVQDARGQPPTVPFWLGEAPARTAELSRAVADLRHTFNTTSAVSHFAPEELPAAAQMSLTTYLSAIKQALGVLPTQECIVIERFFDEAGGMQLIIHAPFGARLNRAWGLALRKRFCRSFNFELQAAATDDALLLSLSEQHSFPLQDVARFLSSTQVHDVLVQALLDAPMFQTRWRWNALRALALPKMRGGKITPPQLLRMASEDLIGAVFPQQLACLENIVGDREIPDHPLVTQTIADCLHEAMDIDGLVQLLQRIESGQVAIHAVDTPEPSPLAHEILNARPYAFLDDAPLEERRARAVYLKRTLDAAAITAHGALDDKAVTQVSNEAWPYVGNVDEAHDALLQLGTVFEHEAHNSEDSTLWLPNFTTLMQNGRAQRLSLPDGSDCYVATERLERVADAYSKHDMASAVELLRMRLEVSGPTTVPDMAARMHLPQDFIEQAMLVLESQGFVLRGVFSQALSDSYSDTKQWCERRLLARIHRLTVQRLRSDIAPVPVSDFLRFLFHWHHLTPTTQMHGIDGLAAVIRQLSGFGITAQYLEKQVLAPRVVQYQSSWLDQLCFMGQVRWARLRRNTAQQESARTGHLANAPLALLWHASTEAWNGNTSTLDSSEIPLGHNARAVLSALKSHGALFHYDIARHSALLPSAVEEALQELAAAGFITSDGFNGVRALLPQSAKRRNLSRHRRMGRSLPVGLDLAGRWSLLHTATATTTDDIATLLQVEPAVVGQVHGLLQRYGVVFRRLLEREYNAGPWRDLVRVLRHLEARGHIRGGRFVAGVSGEQFASPDAVESLRKLRRERQRNSTQGADIVLSAADPLNLMGILTPGERVANNSKKRLIFRDATGDFERV